MAFHGVHTGGIFSVNFQGDSQAFAMIGGDDATALKLLLLEL
jgi:hypothetical protein